MMPTGDAPLYVAGLEELAWGSGLIAITMAVHAVGMVLINRTSSALGSWIDSRVRFAPLLGPLVFSAWMIALLHLSEVAIWAAFLTSKGLLPNASVSYSFALMTYTTLGSQFYLPLDWRMLQGMLAMAGLMTFAWTAGAIVNLAQEFQARHLSGARVGRGAPPARVHPPEPDSR
jgi:hypothetical protein